MYADLPAEKVIYIRHRGSGSCSPDAYIYPPGRRGQVGNHIGVSHVSLSKLSGLFEGGLQACAAVEGRWWGAGV